MPSRRAVSLNPSRSTGVTGIAVAVAAAIAFPMTGTAQAQARPTVKLGVVSYGTNINRHREAFGRIIKKNLSLMIPWHPLLSDDPTRINEAGKRIRYVVIVRETDGTRATLTFQWPKFREFTGIAPGSDLIAEIVAWNVLQDVREGQLQVSVKRNDPEMQKQFCYLNERLSDKDVRVDRTRSLPIAQDCRKRTSSSRGLGRR